MYTPPLTGVQRCRFLETQNRSQKSIVLNAVDEIVMAAACLYAIVEDANDRDELPSDIETLSVMLGALTTSVARINAVALPKGSVDPEEVYADSQLQSWYPTMRAAMQQKEKYRELGLLSGIGSVTVGASPMYHLFSPTPQTSLDLKLKFKANEFMPALDTAFPTIRSYFETIPNSLRILR